MWDAEDLGSGCSDPGLAATTATPYRHFLTAWEWGRSGLFRYPYPLSQVGAAGAQQGPAPVPAPRRRASEQLPRPPLAHSPAQPETEDKACARPHQPEMEVEEVREGPQQQEVEVGACEGPYQPEVEVRKVREGPRQPEPKDVDSEA